MNAPLLEGFTFCRISRIFTLFSLLIVELEGTGMSESQIIFLAAVDSASPVLFPSSWLKLISSNPPNSYFSPPIPHTFPKVSVFSPTSSFPLPPPNRENEDAPTISEELPPHLDPHPSPHPGLPPCDIWAWASRSK